MFVQAYRRRVRQALGTASIAALVIGFSGPAMAAQPSPNDPSGPDTRFIVRLAPGVGTSIDDAVTDAGGTVVAHQAPLDTVVVDGPASLDDVLRDTPDVVGVAPDSPVQLHSLGFDPATQQGSLTNVTRFTGATELWKKGITGNGIDVAVIDTGVAPVSGLSDSQKVVIGPDLSFDSQATNTRHLDGYGHGTAMAGIIAGREVPKNTGAAYAADRTNLYGMAPDARIISIKVGDQNGAVDVSQVIAAISWVATYGKTNGLNIRVLNLSLGYNGSNRSTSDPLSWAANAAVTKGIVVVASVGNAGTDAVQRIMSPGTNTNVIAVGASDTRGTPSYTDDVIPAFSSAMSYNSSIAAMYEYRQPDLVAPGVGIVSLGAPGSVLYNSYAGARVGNGKFRGSGTSQAAAVVSGAAALLLQQRPTMSPQQVLYLLQDSATKLNVYWHQQGKGSINLVNASAMATPQLYPASFQSSGTGLLQNSRGSHKLIDSNGVVLSGEKDVWGRPWSLSGWTNNGSTYNGTVVAGSGFVTDTVTVAGRSWAGRSWAGRSWAGTTWTGRSWASIPATGRSWASTGWTGTVSTPITTPYTSVATNLWATNGWR